MTTARAVHRAWLVLALAFASACATPPSAWTEPTTGMRFVRIPAGAFVMGSPKSEPQRDAGERLHVVRLTRSFYLGVHEVTQAEWSAVMGTNPSHFQRCGPSCPVERVNWHDAQAFLARLSAASGETLRLPTEAEWEYACRAGTTTPFSTGSALTTAQANYRVDDRSAGEPRGLVRDAPARALFFTTEDHPWRQLVLRCRQRALRRAVYAPAAGFRLQHRLPGRPGSPLSGRDAVTRPASPRRR